MPRTTFGQENKQETALGFPKLKLESQERARIVCIETEPVFEYVHTLRAPKIGPDGLVVKKTQTNKDGSTSTVDDTDFIGRPICLGDLTTVAAKGVDPANCPMCEMASKGDMVSPPERRFAMHILRYATQPGGFQPQSPYSVQVLVWAFTDNTFNKLADFQAEWTDLRKHDLQLGPCTNAMYQNFDINVSQTALWLSSPELQAYTADVYRNNQCKDLTAFCGRRADRAFIAQDLDQIRFKNHQAYGGGLAATPAALLAAQVGAPALNVSDLLAAQTGSALPVEPSAPALNLDALLTPAAPALVVPEPAPAVAPVAPAPEIPAAAPAAPVAPAVEAPAVAAPVVQSLDDLLAGLG